MKKQLIYLMMAVAMLSFESCSPADNHEISEIETPENPDDNGKDNPQKPGESDEPETPGEKPDENPGEGSGEEPGEPENKTLVAYFSWGGTTQRMAQEIVRQTGADIFRIEPAVPYPTEYTPCTEAALEEKNSNARPAIKSEVENWDRYDTVFIGCPVWWWTTPMIICTFAEKYDFKGKTVVPFCTYASTYRDETLARIAELTPAASHLTGLGLTSGRISEKTIGDWLRSINLIK